MFLRTWVLGFVIGSGAILALGWGLLETGRWRASLILGRIGIFGIAVGIVVAVIAALAGIE